MTWFNSIISNYRKARDGESYSVLYTIIIGLGFFTTAITWSMYNIYMPAYLSDYLKANWGDLAYSTIIIGFIMVLDNITAVFMQPWIGHLSDHTWSKYSPGKWGRRMPYILVGIPIGAILFSLIGVFGFDYFHGNSMTGFIILLVTVGGFNIAMALYRSPVVALMPDLIPKSHRSRANGLINLMGGVGALIGLFVIPIIYKKSVIAAYISVSLLMVLSLIILVFSIKEPETLKEVEKEEKIKLGQALKELFSKEDKSLIFILFAILSWFFGYNIIETFFSLYGINILNIQKEDASTIFGILALFFILSSVPAGYLAKKLGRKNTILLGLLLVIVALGVAAIFSVVNIASLNERTVFMGMNIPKTAFVIIGSFIVGGVGWAFININSIVIVWTLSGSKTGAGTGIYYFFSALAAIIGPVTIGGIFDLIRYIFHLGAGEQYRSLFFFATFFFIIAAVLMLFVKTTGSEGEKGVDDK